MGELKYSMIYQPKESPFTTLINSQYYNNNTTSSSILVKFIQNNLNNIINSKSLYKTTRVRILEHNVYSDITQSILNTISHILEINNHNNPLFKVEYFVNNCKGTDVSRKDEDIPGLNINKYKNLVMEELKSGFDLIISGDHDSQLQYTQLLSPNGHLIQLKEKEKYVPILESMGLKQLINNSQLTISRKYSIFEQHQHINNQNNQNIIFITSSKTTTLSPTLSPHLELQKRLIRQSTVFGKNIIVFQDKDLTDEDGDQKDLLEMIHGYSRGNRVLIVYIPPELDNTNIEKKYSELLTLHQILKREQMNIKLLFLSLEQYHLNETLIQICRDDNENTSFQSIPIILDQQSTKIVNMQQLIKITTMCDTDLEYKLINEFNSIKILVPIKY